MEFREFLKKIFSDPEGTEEFILENRSHKKSIYMCLIAGFLMLWNTLIFQWVGEHFLPFYLAVLMYLSFLGAAELTLHFLGQQSRILKVIILAIEIGAITIVFNWLIIYFNGPFLFFFLYSLVGLLFVVLYIAYKVAFFCMCWFAYRKSENAEKRGELSRITSWYVLITGLIFQGVFFPLSLAFMESVQRGFGLLVYGFLVLLWWVWSAALCTYILDKQIPNQHLKNSIIAWGSTVLGLGCIIVLGQLVMIILQ
ncbi:MAG: hypothetical protein HWN65_16075 [Candidatus Helarchaeota archaeon]|nr:hypothetical protein [Candidatus Helarchaeota archaeon]